MHQSRFNMVAHSANSVSTYTKLVDFVEALLIGADVEVCLHLEQFVDLGFNDFRSGILALHIDRFYLMSTNTIKRPIRAWMGTGAFPLAEQLNARKNRGSNRSNDVSWCMYLGWQTTISR